MDKDFEKLLKIAKSLSNEQKLGYYVRCKHCACALMTDKGNIYTGIAIETSCDMGFCAEQAAIADMLKNDESKIAKMVTINLNTIYSPCGKCREFIRMINPDNLETNILVADNKIVKLKDLLPFMWKSNKDTNPIKN